MICYDTHIHSEYSSDSKTPVAEQIKQAMKLGLTGICLTDHMDYDFPPDQFECAPGTIPFEFDFHHYLVNCHEEQTIHDDFDFLIGVECGLQAIADVIQKNNALVSCPDLDYVIGSLHLVNRQDPYYPKFWESRNKSEVIQTYFDQLYENLTSFSSFDSLGHLDYIVRYAPKPFTYEPKIFQEITDAILSFLIHHDIALEINTSGLKSTPNTNPHMEFVKRYRELGGKLITIGSDAHTPNYLAYQFDLVQAQLKACGFTEYTVFKKRTPCMLPL